MPKSKNNPPRFAERLEARRLLSASVEVVELGPSIEDDESIAMDLAALPSAVLTAFGGRFPGARMLEAEVEMEESVLEFDVTGHFDGQAFQVTLTQAGRILEIEQSLSSADLPASVMKWVRAQFPGGRVHEAARVTEGADQTYDLAIASAGDGLIEATLRVTDEAAQTNTTSIPVTEAAATPPHEWCDSVIADETPGAPLALTDDGVDAPACGTAPLRFAAPDGDFAGDVAVLISQTFGAGAQAAKNIDLVAVAATLATPGGPVRWLPQFAGLLGDAPLDEAAVVAEPLLELLRRIEAAKTTPSELPGLLELINPRRVWTGVALVTGAVLVFFSGRARDVRSPRLTPADSQWSWILQAVPKHKQPPRPRR